MKTLTVLIALIVSGCANVVQAQVVTAPTSLTFPHPDTEYAITLRYHFDFFQCASVSLAGACVGRAATPFQAGFDVPKTQVTGAATTRTINLTIPPPSTFLASMPGGTAFVAAVLAVGDPATGGTGSSARSGDSAPFFTQGRVPAVPGAPVLQ